jgi:hypothetical protein
VSKENGKFEKGNTIGFETRFKPGHKLSLKYKQAYCDSLLKYFKECEECPTIEGWANSNNISISAARVWVSNPKKYPHFATIYEQALSIQKDKLIQKGLLEGYNVQLVKFLLTNNHDMRDKTEQKFEGETSTAITVNIREVN